MGFALGPTDESPVHLVELKGFWIDQTEITNAQFAQFVAQTGHVTTAEQLGGSQVTRPGTWAYTPGADWQHPHGPADSIDGKEDYPVVQVSWEDAGAYCAWAGRRLPTEAEWEYAARGLTIRRFPWGDDRVADGLLNMADVTNNGHIADLTVNDGYQFSAPVGSFPAGASPFGVLDMAGNVWEWVSDFYQIDYYKMSPAKDPRGPAAGDHHVIRGGSWNEISAELRTANRHVLQDHAYNDLGFRCLSDK
jgi:formylglycine-generating enzyme required for sulfatase activity